MATYTMIYEPTPEWPDTWYKRFGRTFCLATIALYVIFIPIVFGAWLICAISLPEYLVHKQAKVSPPSLQSLHLSSVPYNAYNHKAESFILPPYGISPVALGTDAFVDTQRPPADNGSITRKHYYGLGEDFRWIHIYVYNDIVQIAEQS